MLQTRPTIGGVLTIAAGQEWANVSRVQPGPSARRGSLAPICRACMQRMRRAVRSHDYAPCVLFGPVQAGCPDASGDKCATGSPARPSSPTLCRVFGEHNPVQSGRCPVLFIGVPDNLAPSGTSAGEVQTSAGGSAGGEVRSLLPLVPGNHPFYQMGHGKVLLTEVWRRGEQRVEGMAVGWSVGTAPNACGHNGQRWVAMWYMPGIH
jgi:hypothetical protein